MRLDQLLVDQGLVENPSKARARIMAGDVIVNDHIADKAGAKYAPDVTIRLRGNSHPYVSRGALKLLAALKAWDIRVKDTICMDVGASTGGFTEVLLEHGAQLVYAIDVGHAQLAEKLRQDSRVINMEKTHILKMDGSALRALPSMAVIDVSFISLYHVLKKVMELVERPAYIVALIKPQFEVGPKFIEKGGIVRDEAARQASIDKIVKLVRDEGAELLGVLESPILGTKGNQEFLIGLRW